ncbi:MAG: hypothetical protein AB8C13_09705 [Phycisphaerales bacterium]
MMMTRTLHFVTWPKAPAALVIASMTVLGTGVLSVSGCGDSASVDDLGIRTGSILNDARVIGETGIHPGQFVYPRAMDVFQDEDRWFVAVIDKTARLQIIDIERRESVGEVLMPVFDRGMPTGLTVGVSLLNQDRLAAYVADTHEHQLLMYEFPLPKPGYGKEAELATQAAPDFVFGVYGEGPDEFVYPTDVIVLTEEGGAVSQLLISEYGGNDRISRYAVSHDRADDQPDEQVVLSWDGQIGTPSETVDGSDGEIALSRPQSIGVWENDGQRELIVVDSSHHRIGRVAIDGKRDGELIAWFEKDHDPTAPVMNFPYGVTVLEDGTALVTEFGGCIVRRMDLVTGMTLEIFGTAGRGEGELATPWASTVVDGDLVVLDSGNNRIQVVSGLGLLAVGQLSDAGSAP